ncbi:MAG: alpha-amylase [Xanthobacteraceae bacterium]|nr:alpha-amylase [Xanthobacteraceae bacterium]
MAAAAPAHASDPLPMTPPAMDHDMDDHAKVPAGVFGGAMVGQGHFMLSYTPMFMGMQGNYIGTSKVSPDYIATKVPLASPVTMSSGMGMPMTMNTYRIVPTTMYVQSNMVHAMYGVTDWMNVMVMGSYMEKNMTMTTYAGAMGTTVKGTSIGDTSGFGDTMVTTLWRVYQDPIHHVHLNMGLSLPSGSTTENVTMLSPMGSYMTMRGNYGMQLGTGTVDFMPGATYTGHIDRWSWGATYRGRYALDSNSEGYHYGQFTEFSGWGGYTLIPGVTVTGRAVGTVQGHIQGADPMISGVMQGANPLFYGGKRVDLLGGVELDGGPLGFGRNLHFEVEAGAPVYLDLNGPQLGGAWQLIFAAKAGF